jgi:hypothetical protein
MSSSFRENLRLFNRKERFYVVKQATEGGFEIDKTFKQLLEKELGIVITDQSAYMAMDYHLDWIYASLFLANQPEDNTDITKRIFDRDNELITASQEDVDLLIAAPDTSNSNITNLIMIEAKGATSWTNEQAESKANRLKTIFQAGTFEHILKPHYLIWSPNPSQKLKFECFPEWALLGGVVPHIKLNMDENLRKVTRCNQLGKNDSEGKYWKVSKAGR